MTLTLNFHFQLTTTLQYLQDTLYYSDIDMLILNVLLLFFFFKNDHQVQI
jgi:hypothetical protein